MSRTKLSGKSQSSVVYKHRSTVFFFFQFAHHYSKWSSDLIHDKNPLFPLKQERKPFFKKTFRERKTEKKSFYGLPVRKVTLRSDWPGDKAKLTSAKRA